MTSMTAATPTTTKPAITHPAWCDPDQCSEDRSNGGTLHAVNHRSPLSELTLTTPGAENSTLRIRAWLTQFDDYDEASVTRSAAVPYLDADVPHVVAEFIAEGVLANPPVAYLSLIHI